MSDKIQIEKTMNGWIISKVGYGCQSWVFGDFIKMLEWVALSMSDYSLGEDKFTVGSKIKIINKGSND